MLKIVYSLDFNLGNNWNIVYVKVMGFIKMYMSVLIVERNIIIIVQKKNLLIKNS